MAMFANTTKTEYRSEKTGDIRRYLLPHRPIGGLESKLGKYARIAAIVGAVGVVLLFIFGILPMLFSIASLISQFFQPAVNNAAGVENFTEIAVLLFGFPATACAFYVVKFTLLAVAIYQGRSRCEVLVGQKDVVHRELFYGFSFKFRQAVEDVENIYLNPLIPADAKAIAEDKAGFDFLLRLVPEELFALGFKNRNSVPIAFGYSLDVLSPLAKDIRRDLVREKISGRDEFEVVNRTAYVRTEEDRIADSRVADSDSAQWESLDDEGLQIELPEDSLIEVVEQNDAVVYRLPRSGFFGVRGWSWFVVVVAVVFVILSVLVLLPGQNNDIKTVTTLGGFSCVLLAASVGVWYLGSREAMLGVDGGLLFIEEKSICGTRWTEFHNSQLDRVAVEDSNVSIDDIPVKHLVIQPKQGKIKGHFRQLSNQELFWLAQQLNQQLMLKDTSETRLNSLFDQDGEIRELGPTRLIIDTQTKVVKISVPRFDFWRLFVQMLIPGGIVLVAIAFLIFAISLKELFLALLAGATVIGAVAIAIAMLAYLTRSFQVIVEPTELVVDRSGLLSRKTFRLSRAEFEAVRVQDSGTIVNGKKLHNLVFDSVQRRGVFKMMLGWSIPELKYVAALITQALGNPTEN